MVEQSKSDRRMLHRGIWFSGNHAMVYAGSGALLVICDRFIDGDKHLGDLGTLGVGLVVASLIAILPGTIDRFWRR